MEKMNGAFSLNNVLVGTVGHPESSELFDRDFPDRSNQAVLDGVPPIKGI